MHCGQSPSGRMHEESGGYGTRRTAADRTADGNAGGTGNYCGICSCGGGTIPLLQQWLWEGMSMGSAAVFMITGPATKITNLGALKIAMGWKRFALYLLFVMLFSFLCGMAVNLLI